MPNADRPPVVPLSQRESGKLPEEILYEDVPPHLTGPLRAWAKGFLTHALATRVALRLRLKLPDKAPEFGKTTNVDKLVADPTASLLDIVDVALQLDERLHGELIIGMEEATEVVLLHNEYSFPGWVLPDLRWPAESERARRLTKLDEILADAGSAYRVDSHLPPMLVRRVDPTVEAAAEQTIAAADPTASDLLRSAWRQAYGRNPDPTTAYRDAVRAVEEVACPLISSNNKKATLGSVISDLKQGGHKWAFVLLDKDGDGTVETLVSMLDRLWTGQISRHGGAAKNRNQTQAEAEAAVHLATTLVQLLSSGTLTRRTAP